MDRIGQKPLMEFGGPDLQTASLEITLDVALGVSPSELLETLEYMTESGNAYELILENACWRESVGYNKVFCGL